MANQMNPEYRLDRTQFESLMKRLRVPRSEWPKKLEGTGLWLLHRWRESVGFCCIEVYSDHSYVWDVYWSYSDIDPMHLRHSVRTSFAHFDDAIYFSAAAACGINVKRPILSTLIRARYEHQDEDLKTSIFTQVDRFFASNEHDSR